MRDRLQNLANRHSLSTEALSELEQLLDEMAPRQATARLTRAGEDEGLTTRKTADEPLTTQEFKERYEDLGQIGRGGFSEVREAFDRHVRRRVALKIQLSSRTSNEDTARFRREAHLTARLQHPGIVPVYDWGELADGRIWLSMKRVQGKTLASLIRDLHTQDGGAFLYTLRRLLDDFQRLCEAVAYAHAQRIIHRDISPSNLMVARLGEVHVMDWGLACDLSDTTATTWIDNEGPHLPTPNLSDKSVRARVTGTPYYMSPEQVRGEISAIGTASDVYAFGAVLYEILSGHPPYVNAANDTQSPARIVERVRTGPPRPIEEIAKPQCPKELLTLCRKAMAREAANRYPDAGQLAIALRDWREGADRRAKAQTIVQEARTQHETKLRDMRAQAAELRTKARVILDKLKPFDRAQEKAEGWTFEDAAALVDQAILREEISWTQKLRSALNEAPDLEEAHADLAAYYEQSFLRADALHDDVTAMSYAALLENHAHYLPTAQRLRYEALLKGDGRLTLVTDPRDAQLLVEPYELVNRYLMPNAKRAIKVSAPVHGLALPRGSYLVTLSAPGYRKVSYPVFIGRGEHWDGVRPLTNAPSPVEILRADALGEDDIYVPAGWFIAGGDPRAGEGLARRRAWVDAFIIRKYPVTNLEYVAFLNALLLEGRDEEAFRYCPGPFPGMESDGEDKHAYRYDPKKAQFSLRNPGAHARLPVVAVDWFSASAYAEHLAHRDGCAWRLPSEFEWEKAARGVDGRFMPWGDQIEPTWACVSGSHADRKQAMEVDRSPTDTSPYGVCGMAGNVRDWCLEPWSLEGPDIANDILQIKANRPRADIEMAVRGGAWISTGDLIRLGVRYAERPQKRHGVLGFRLARSL